MRQVGRQQEDLTLVDGDVDALAVLHGGQRDTAFELVEEFLARVDVKILAAVRPADHHDDELAVREHELVAHGRLEQVAVFVDPTPEIEGLEFSHRSLSWQGADHTR